VERLQWANCPAVMGPILARGPGEYQQGALQVEAQFHRPHSLAARSNEAAAAATLQGRLWATLQPSGARRSPSGELQAERLARHLRAHCFHAPVTRRLEEATERPNPPAAPPKLSITGNGPQLNRATLGAARAPPSSPGPSGRTMIGGSQRRDTLGKLEAQLVAA